MDDGMLAWTEDNLLRQVVYEMKGCARISRRPRCGGRGRGPALIGNKIKLFVAGTRQPHRPPPRSLRQGAGAGSRKVVALLGNNEPPLAEGLPSRPVSLSTASQLAQYRHTRHPGPPVATQPLMIVGRLYTPRRLAALTNQ